MSSQSSDLMRLLEIIEREELAFLDAHQHRVQFYSSIMSALIAATVAGALNANKTSHYLLLLAGPALVVALSILGLEGTKRFYQRFLEAVTVKAKIQQALGLTRVRGPATDAPNAAADSYSPYWPDEPLVAPRHMKARRSADSSDAFVTVHMNRGYQAPTRRLFFAFATVGVALAIALTAMACAH